jgi:hypothetical protein
MINYTECARKLLWPNVRYYPGTGLEGLRKITKNLSHDSRSPGRVFNPRPPEYEAGVLTTRPRRSVNSYLKCYTEYVKIILVL